MPTKGSKKITEQLFNTVTAQLQSNVNTPDMRIVIAKANGIKPSTVRTIGLVKTWENYQARKKQLDGYRKGEKKLDAIVGKPANQIRAKSDYKKVSLTEWNELQNSLRVLLDERKETRSEIRQLHKRLDFVNSRVGQLNIVARPKNPLAAIWSKK
jgi:hypothetical protein